MMARRIFSMARKETFHILRDPFTLIMALILPMILVAIFGTAIDFDVRNVEIAVDDRDHSESSRLIADMMKNSRVFRVENVSPESDPERLIRKEEVKGVWVIPPEFEKHMLSGSGASIQVLFDGADNATAGTILGYTTGLQEAMNRSLVIRSGEAIKRTPINFKPKMLFNPELKSAYFVVPGLAVVVTAIISILLTSLTVAREWEQGSMELLLSTPVRPIEIVMGKLLPYTVLGIFAVAFVYGMARVGFGIPFRGSHWFFALGTLLFLSAYLAQGLLISIIGKKQVISMQLSMFSGLLPSLLLSGFIFPIESMPTFFHYFTAILPARWFMVLSRNAFLSGEMTPAVWQALAMLVLLNVVLISVAAKKFQRNLE